MGFINDMLGIEQSRYQRKIKQSIETQEDQAAFMLYYLNYAANSAYRQELLAIDTLNAINALNETLSRPVSVVSV